MLHTAFASQCRLSVQIDCWVDHTYLNASLVPSGNLLLVNCFVLAVLAPDLWLKMQRQQLLCTYYPKS